MFARVWAWYPPVGVFIALLAVVGVLVPVFRDLAKVGRREKAIWTVVMFMLMGLEIRSIYMDRDTHDREQAAAKKEQLEQFSGIANGLTSAIRQDQEHFDATILDMQILLRSSGEISHRSLASLNTVTGGDSFCYANITAGANGLVLVPVGDFPLHNLHMQVEDYTDKDEKTFDFPTYTAHVTQPLYPIAFAKDKTYEFGISFDALNGFWYEMLQLRYVNGTWAYAIQVTKSPIRVRLDEPYEKQEKTLLNLIDPKYPRSDGGVKWQHPRIFAPPLKGPR